MHRNNCTARVLPAIFAATLLSFTMAESPAQDRQRGEKFTRSQKLGYLGRTSRSAMARNVLERLKNQREVRDVSDHADRVLMWHEVMLDSIAIDHTPDPDTGEVDFAQGGPTRTSRALAITQIAVFDAANSVESKYVPYSELAQAPENASIDAAVAYASFTALSALYPDQVDRLSALLESDLAQIDDDEERISAGKIVGQAAAQAILDTRTNDNSDDVEPNWGEGGRIADGATSASGAPVNSGATEVFDWEPDPLTPSTSGDFSLALGAYWGGVTPFSINSGDQFRTESPPEPGSFEYIFGYWLVQKLGASPDTTGSWSNPLTRFIGNYWGYDATPLLGTPPRLYNQIAVLVAKNEGITNATDMSRYLAMINTGLADAGVAAWDSKYYYNYWRPVTGIATSDDVLLTFENPLWEPVGISVINTETAIRPTPPFPAYPSGHSTFGASTFEIMRQFFGNQTRFTFVSDEYNGEGVDPLGVPRPLVPVRFQTLDGAQSSNGISRVFNGVHWQWDNVRGLEMGENIGKHIVFTEDSFQPLERPKNQQRDRQRSSRNRNR